ncbi:hypothetical protein [Arenimonas terrae]|uniref:Lipoprotein n=1 Tax=Arenimonas terrae TaxID=2546226 RepID=A0A5C4RV25_9GAMM|nr:hypothetical protein [Arenimonas terrae]TNJ34782.1 hypothetical protein E1B00_03090 [Arenimonas terrae]
MTLKTPSCLPLALLFLALAACSPPAPEAAVDTVLGADEDRRIELEKRRDQVEADRATIGPFRLISSRYRHQAQESGWQRPMLDLVLENGTRLSVARFTVLLTLSSPGRKEPWLRQEFLVNMKNTLAPGQRHETTLTPSPDSEWGLLQAPTDARMRVDVMSVRTPEGETYLGPGAFTPQDAVELVRLNAAR